jgi:hypothetical protein
VHQAHLPGNYELYDPDSDKPGQVLCKGCWENHGVVSVDSLDTVWVSCDGWLMVWWLCKEHEEEIRLKKPANTQFLRSVQGVVRAPGLVLRN